MSLLLSLGCMAIRMVPAGAQCALGVLLGTPSVR
jgi:hypothetical protein